jgi:hypothetical protein
LDQQGSAGVKTVIAGKNFGATGAREVRHDHRNRKFLVADADHCDHAVSYKRQLQRDGDEFE